MSVKAKGPTREQLNDQEWAAVCNLFSTIARVKREHFARLSQAGAGHA